MLDSCSISKRKFMFVGSSSSSTTSSSSSSSSTSVFDKLTDELLIETLIRLPVKTAHLCKCVSARFRSLISTSYFVRCYVNHHPNRISNSCFALYYQSKPTFHNIIRPPLMFIDLAFESPIFQSPGFSLSFLPSSSSSSSQEQLNQETLQYLASNSGLILCCATLRRPILYFVCNPLTKQWVALPPPPSNLKTVYIGFICNPQYVCHDDDDKQVRNTSFTVVRIEVVNSESPSQLSGTLKLEIFSSLTGRWTEEYYMSSDHELFYGWNYRCPSAVVSHGLLHWDTLSNCGIFTYDHFKGECTTIELPNEIRKPVWAFKHCLGDCSGQLRYANFSWDDTSYRVWELKDGEWLLLHKVHLDEMIPAVETINKDCMGLLSPHPLNQDVVFFWCRGSCRIVVYHMESKLLQLPGFIRDAKVISLLSPMFFPFVLPTWPTAVPRIQQHDLS